MRSSFVTSYGAFRGRRPRRTFPLNCDRVFTYSVGYVMNLHSACAVRLRLSESTLDGQVPEHSRFDRARGCPRDERVQRVFLLRHRCARTWRTRRPGEMVVDEGKNVFFTGAAGEWHLRVTFLCLSYAICRCVNSVRTECCEYCYEASPLNLSSGSVPRIVYVLPQTFIYAPVIEFSRRAKACVVL